jgi:hypothetical protein
MLSMLHRLSGQSMRPVLSARLRAARHGFRDEVLALADRRPGISALLIAIRARRIVTAFTARA